jgi:hypothetical protein
MVTIRESITPALQQLRLAKIFLRRKLEVNAGPSVGDIARPLILRNNAPSLMPLVHLIKCDGPYGGTNTFEARDALS